jgi:hypothetical protein
MRSGDAASSNGAVTAAPPVFVVVPVKDQLRHTRGIVEQLAVQGGYDRLFVFDNGSGRETAAFLARRDGQGGVEVVDAAGWSLHDMWQEGVDRARARSTTCDVAILNNDLRLGPRFLASLSTSLRSHPTLWAVSPRYDDRRIEGIEYVSGTFKDGGLAGFAYMVRGEAFDHVAFDRRFLWWYGDDDLVAQIEALGRKVAITGATWVEHVDGGSQTLQHVAGIVPQLAADRIRMLRKWGYA